MNTALPHLKPQTPFSSQETSILSLKFKISNGSSYLDTFRDKLFPRKKGAYNHTSLGRRT